MLGNVPSSRIGDGRPQKVGLEVRSDQSGFGESLQKMKAEQTCATSGIKNSAIAFAVDLQASKKTFDASLVSEHPNEEVVGLAILVEYRTQHRFSCPLITSRVGSLDRSVLVYPDFGRQPLGAFALFEQRIA